VTNRKCVFSVIENETPESGMYQNSVHVYSFNVEIIHIIRLEKTSSRYKIIMSIGLFIHIYKSDVYTQSRYRPFHSHSNEFRNERMDHGRKTIISCRFLVYCPRFSYQVDAFEGIN